MEDSGAEAEGGQASGYRRIQLRTSSFIPRRRLSEPMLSPLALHCRVRSTSSSSSTVAPKRCPRSTRFVCACPSFGLPLPLRRRGSSIRPESLKYALTHFFSHCRSSCTLGASKSRSSSTARPTESPFKLTVPSFGVSDSTTLSSSRWPRSSARLELRC